MAVPKRRTSKARKRKRRAHIKMRVPAMSLCPQCGNIVQPYHACPYCGVYKGRKVLAVDEEAE